MIYQWNTLAKGRIVPLKLQGPWSSLDDDGTVKKCSCCTIFELIPLLNSLTCLRMYRRKASLDHLPNNIMVNTGTCARYTAMAALLHAECDPISFAEKPRMSSPSTMAADRSHFSSSDPVNKCFFHQKNEMCLLKR